ncbi:MAG: TetR/AcrR family transcriptional regulator C-terminal domain-containing protein [Kineosporiaceae bacterium]|nr:TetR/AcrR family transcriptional regulator C-terminal domain-containing protein [Kineosporiaceae bacterium]
MGRPPQPLLSREAIARAALELLDAEGPDGLGMRRIAEQLGVRAPSLYNHVSGQDEIIDLVHDLIDREIDTATLANPDWRQGLDAFARSYRQAFLRHPHAIALVARRPILNHATLNLYDSAAAALGRAGLPPADVMPVIAILDYLVLGSTVETFIGGFAAAPEEYRTRYPDLASALAATDRATVDDDAFELALDLMLNDLEGRVSRSATGRSRKRRAASRMAPARGDKRPEKPGSADDGSPRAVSGST